MKLPSTSDEAANYIDQTLLRPELPESTYKQWLIDNARRKFKTLIVPPYYVPLASMYCIETETRVGSVIGFPMGFMVRHTKIQALKDLIDRGVEEIDFVVNISFLKSGNDAEFKGELKDLRAYANSRKTVRDEPVILKGIIECCYLTEAEKRWAVEHLANTGIDFVKTSTGTAQGGATVNDIVLIKSSSQKRIAIKASGGIRTKEDMEKMLKAGADRIGSSYGAHIIAEYISMPEF